jgi:large subunit ribosomal protein L6
VDVTIDGSTVTVKGPKGVLSRQFHPNIAIEKDESVLNVSRPNNAQQNRALHGLTRSLLANMVTGVSEGFKKELEVNGIGYRAVKQGKQVVLNIGYSHQVFIEEEPGITIEVPAPNKIIILGADKQQVGQFAAEVREKRPPEPYKGKGIKYATEVIRRKEGKTGKGK